MVQVMYQVWKNYKQSCSSFAVFCGSGEDPNCKPLPTSEPLSFVNYKTTAWHQVTLEFLDSYIICYNLILKSSWV